MVPGNYVKLEGKDAQNMLRLMDALEDLDDVQNVYANFDIHARSHGCDGGMMKRWMAALSLAALCLCGILLRADEAEILQELKFGTSEKARAGPGRGLCRPRAQRRPGPAAGAERIPRGLPPSGSSAPWAWSKKDEALRAPAGDPGRSLSSGAACAGGQRAWAASGTRPLPKRAW